MSKMKLSGVICMPQSPADRKMKELYLPNPWMRQPHAWPPSDIGLVL